MSTIYDLFVGLGLDTSSYQSGLAAAIKDGQAGSQAIASSFKSTGDAVNQLGESTKKYSSTFNNEFLSGLSRGSATTNDFRSQLMEAANQAGLGTSELRKMATATGLFTDKEILAGKASADMATRARELAGAVQRGEMTTREAGRAFGDYARSMEVSEGSSKSFIEQIGAMKTQIVAAVGVVVAFGAALKVALDLGEQGAIVNQTAESFDLLIQKVGATPDLLNQLREASRGTVDDMTLMSSTATLLAGTSGDLATNLANAAPELMEIAKAANKLNPALGDTTFMYQSLATGVKRASPMLIDNLGLKIRLGDASQKLADQLGKSVEELTSEEQQMALLNATLEAGRSMIDQVGGSTDSATDAFLRLKANSKDLTDALKGELAPAAEWLATQLNKAVEAVILMMEWDDKLQTGLQEHEADMRAAATTHTEYWTEMKRAAEVAGYTINESGDLVTETYDDMNGTMEVLVQKNFALTDSIWSAVKAGDDAVDMHERLRTAAVDDAEANAAITKTLEDGRKELEEYTKAIENLSNLRLDMGMGGGISKTWDDYKAKVTDLREANAGLTEDIKKLVSEGIDPNSEQIATLTQRYNDNVAKQNELRDAAREATKELIFQKVSAFMSGDAALALARSMGLLSQTDYDASTAIIGLVKQFDTLKQDGFIETGEANAEFIARLTALGSAFTEADEAMQPFNESLKEQIIAARQAAIEEQRLVNVQEALEAGLSGTLNSAMRTYQQSIVDASDANVELIAQYNALRIAGGDNADQLADLTEQIDANTKKQYEALEAMKKTTAEMIYQHASQGLSADAALVLARGLGLVSEEDYDLIVQLQALRAQFDSNHDGMISAAEGADQYTAAVLRLYSAQVQLMSVLPNGEGVGGNGYVGNGIYVGGPGETIGPGTMSGPALPGVYTGGPGETIGPGVGAPPVINYYNNGIDMAGEQTIQRILAPYVQNINRGR